MAANTHRACADCVARGYRYCQALERRRRRCGRRGARRKDARNSLCPYISMALDAPISKTRYTTKLYHDPSVLSANKMLTKYVRLMIDRRRRASLKEKLPPGLIYTA